MSSPCLILDDLHHADLAEWLARDVWVVACLCAAWCDSCRSYQPAFEQLAGQHPDKRFVWIDIEDQADLLGDIDVDNFPTLLIQRGDAVTFFGAVLPDIKLADRLIQAQAEKSETELQAATSSSLSKTNNLRARLADDAR